KVTCTCSPRLRALRTSPARRAMSRAVSVVIEAPVTTGGREDTLTGKTNFSGMPQRRVARLSRANSPVAHQPPRSEGLEDRRLVVRLEAQLPWRELTGC